MENSKVQSEFDITLKRIREDDLEQIMRWRMSKDVTKYMYTDPVLTIDDQRKWFNHISKPNSEYWTINIDGRSVGIIGITDINCNMGSGNLDWYIGEKIFRGKGISWKVLLNVFDYFFEEKNFLSIGCEVLCVNDYVINHIYKKCGFIIKSVLKDYVKKYNKYYDVLFMEITYEIWKGKKAEFSYPPICIEV